MVSHGDLTFFCGTKHVDLAILGHFSSLTCILIVMKEEDLIFLAVIERCIIFAMLLHIYIYENMSSIKKNVRAKY